MEKHTIWKLTALAVAIALDLCLHFHFFSSLVPEVHPDALVIVPALIFAIELLLEVQGRMGPVPAGIKGLGADLVSVSAAASQMSKINEFCSVKEDSFLSRHLRKFCS